MKSSFGTIPARPIIQPKVSFRWAASMVTARLPESHCAMEKQTPPTAKGRDEGGDVEPGGDEARNGPEGEAHEDAEQRHPAPREERGSSRRSP